METDYLTAQEAAERLGVTSGRVYQLAAEGMPSRKVGFGRIFPRREFEAWLSVRQGRGKAIGRTEGGEGCG